MTLNRLGLRDRLIYLALTRPRLLFELTSVAPVEQFAERTPPRFQRIVERYKRGIAQALGVSPEDINEEVVRRWAIHWLRAMVKPEAWEKYGLA
jgi:hypothetical protein